MVCSCLPHEFKFVKHQADRLLWTYGALMTEVEAEVDGGLAHFGLKVSCLLEDQAHQGQDLFAHVEGLQAPEEGGEGLLNQLQHQQEDLQHWVLDALLHEL